MTLFRATKVMDPVEAALERWRRNEIGLEGLTLALRTIVEREVARARRLLVESEQTLGHPDCLLCAARGARTAFSGQEAMTRALRAAKVLSQIPSRN